MKTNSTNLNRVSPRSRVATDIKSLVNPIAAYVAATPDPKMVLGEILTLLVTETNAIEAAAQGYLDLENHQDKP
jgi:hypothetical protein